MKTKKLEPSSRRATIRDIAEDANLSVGAVSQILNGKRKGRPENVAKINDAIKRFGYRSNMTARSLASGQTKTIGLAFFFDPEDLFNAKLLRSVEAKCREAGYDLIPNNLHPSDYPELKHRDITSQARNEVFENLIDRRVDGIISQGFIIDRKAAKSLINENIKLAIWEPEVSMPRGVTTCKPDWNEVMWSAVHHLHGLGFKNFHFMAGLDKFATTREEVSAYKKAVAALDIVNPSITYSDTLTSDEFAFKAMGELTSKLAGTNTAVICADDRMAIGALASCQRLGFKVPDELSIIGINDAFYARYTYPPLTTVRIHYEDAANKLVNGLLGLLQDGGGVHSKCSSELVVRGSTASLR